MESDSLLENSLLENKTPQNYSMTQDKWNISDNNLNYENKDSKIPIYPISEEESS